MLKRLLGRGRLERKLRIKGQPTKAALFCGNCGNEYVDSDNFCQQCGLPRFTDGLAEVKSAKAIHTPTARPYATGSSNENDCEAAVVPRRRVRNEGAHRAPPRFCGFGSLMSKSDKADNDEETEGLFSFQHFSKVERKKKQAKRVIMTATSMRQLVDLANEHIEDDWLNFDEFPGNIYRVAAYGKMWWFDENTSYLYDLSRMLGCSLIFFIQMVGPPSLFFAAILGWGIRPSFYAAEVAVPHIWDFTAWENRKTTKILAMLFIACFCLNGVFVILDEMKSWRKMNATFRYLNQKTETFLRGEGWLFLDAMANCWTIVWCCLCSSVVVAPAQTPKDVVFDSLGLLFLYNLDDIGGDFGFLNADDWPGERLAWIYNEMVSKTKLGDSHDAVAEVASFANEGYDADEDTFSEKCGTCFVIMLYRVTTATLTIFFFALPVFTAVTSFESGNNRHERINGAGNAIY